MKQLGNCCFKMDLFGCDVDSGDEFGDTVNLAKITEYLF